MRRFDKKKNIDKVNLLAEQTHLSLMSEISASQRDISILISAQNSLRDIQKDSIFAKILNEDQIRILNAAQQVCVDLENRIK